VVRIGNIYFAISLAAVMVTNLKIYYISKITVLGEVPRVGSGIVRIDPLRGAVGYLSQPRVTNRYTRHLLYLSYGNTITIAVAKVSRHQHML